MTAMIGYAVLTFLSQVFIYVLLPYRLAARLAPDRGPADRVMLALLLGVSSQALAGVVFNIIPVRLQWLEPWLYMGGWLTTSVLAGSRLTPACDFRTLARSALPLAGVLLLGYVVRIVHPLSTWALGQSDAYGHLQYLNDIISVGRVTNSSYPPGQAWIMLLPCKVFGLEPYYVCRFGGAFFGLAMVLAVYALVRECAGRQAAYVAALLVTSCAAFNVLIKTGVGTFANQVGLMMVPAILWALLVWGRHDCRWRPWGFLTALFTSCLAATVPMMLMSLVPLMALLRIMASLIPSERSCWVRKTMAWGMALSGAVVVAGMLMLAVGTGSKAPEQTTRMLTGSGVVKQAHKGENVGAEARKGALAGASLGPVAMVGHVVGDFVSVKRCGFPMVALNLAMLGLGAVFLAALALGVRRRDDGLIMLGAWGALAVFTTFTGALQFSQYQRDGWTLAIAAACGCGFAFAAAWKWLNRGFLRGTMAAGLAMASLTGVLLPPAHRAFTSPAESDVVRLLLAIGGNREAQRNWPAARGLWEDPASVRTAFVVARRFSGFIDGRGDPVAAIRGRHLSRTELGGPRQSDLTYLLIDHEDENAVASPPALMKVLQPELTRQFSAHRAYMKKKNEALLATMNSMTNVTASKVAVSPTLDVWVLKRDSAKTLNPGLSEGVKQKAADEGGMHGDN